jgi:hypothetical protein
LALAGLYFRNFVFGTTEEWIDYMAPQTDSAGFRLTRGLQVLAIAFGLGGAETVWPFSGPTVAVLLLITAGLLIVTFWNQTRERQRVLGLLLFVGFVSCYALLVGWERQLCFVGYYGIIPALGLCCMYYVWGLYGSPRVGAFAQVVLFACVCAVFPFNTHNGLVYARDHHYRQMEPLEQALREGTPPYKIITYHRMALDNGYHNTGDYLIPLLRSLRESGCGNFRYMGEDPPFQEVPISLTPTAVKGLIWDKGTARVSAKDSYLIFPVPESRRVAGVRITYVHSSDTGGRPAFQLFWKRSDQKEFPPDQSLFMPWLETGPDEKTTGTIWIDQTIDQLRIHPDDKPCDFKILKVVLIVPAHP